MGELPWWKQPADEVHSALRKFCRQKNSGGEPGWRPVWLSARLSGNDSDHPVEMKHASAFLIVEAGPAGSSRGHGLDHGVEPELSQ